MMSVDLHMFILTAALALFPARGSLVGLNCHPETGSCFGLVDYGLFTQSEAKLACASEGYNLAVMETEELWTFVKNVTEIWDRAFVKSGSGGVWVGLTDVAVEGVFVWDNGETLNYDPWKKSSVEPNGGDGENCAAAVREGVIDVICNSRESVALCSTSANYHIVFKHMYDEATFYDAEATCRSRGMNLLSVRTLNQENQLQQLHISDGVWLGLTDLEEESVFRWLDGGKVAWSSWGSPWLSAPEPNGGTAENCAVRRVLGDWADYSCTQHKKFYCEFTGRVLLNDDDLSALTDGDHTTCRKTPKPVKCVQGNYYRVWLESELRHTVVVVSMVISGLSCYEPDVMVTWTSALSGRHHKCSVARAGCGDSACACAYACDFYVDVAKEIAVSLWLPLLSEVTLCEVNFKHAPMV